MTLIRRVLRYGVVASLFILGSGIGAGCSSLIRPSSCSEQGQRDVDRAALWLLREDSTLESLGSISDCDSGGNYIWMFRALRQPDEILSDLDPTVCQLPAAGWRVRCRLDAENIDFEFLFDVNVHQDRGWYAEVTLLDQ